MTGIAAQISSDTGQNLSPPDWKNINRAHGPTDSNAEPEGAQNELLVLTLQQAEVEKRIAVVRRTILALVRTFGPGVLHGTSNRANTVPGRFNRHSEVIELCRQNLKHSPAGLTSRQLTETIWRQSPRAFAGHEKAGVVTANVLRVLQRSGEVECRREHGKHLLWRTTAQGSRTTEAKIASLPC